MKKNLTWFAALLLLSLFTLPATMLADGPTPNCQSNPQSCQPPDLPQLPVPHLPGN